MDANRVVDAVRIQGEAISNVAADVDAGAFFAIGVYPSGGRQEPHPHWSRLIVVSLTVSSN
jgi:hypothetical protein